MNQRRVIPINNLIIGAAFGNRPIREFREKKDTSDSFRHLPMYFRKNANVGPDYTDALTQPESYLLLTLMRPTISRTRLLSFTNVFASSFLHNLTSLVQLHSTRTDIRPSSSCSPSNVANSTFLSVHYDARAVLSPSI